MSFAPPAKPLFDLKSTAWVLTALRLHTADSDMLGAALDARFADSPGLFDDDPLVVDLSPLRNTGARVDFSILLAHLRRHRMLPIAAQGGSPAQMQAAREAGLAQATEPESRTDVRTAVVAVAAVAAMGDSAEPGVGALPVETTPPAEPVDVDAAASPMPLAARLGAPTVVVDKPLRSGQRVYARGSDLVVLSAVSFGAEVIADGNIHVYGPLRGRALAGARGDTSARIFSTCMEPQLVSIAGIYRTTETPLPDSVVAKPAQVRLSGDSILVEPLGG